MGGIFVGAEAINRASQGANTYTYIDLANPANVSGILANISIWAKTNMTGLRVGTFYLVSGTDYKCRDSETIGAVTAGSKQTFPVTLNIVAGDFIGCYFGVGEIECDTSGGSGVMVVSGEYIDPDDQTTYNSVPGYAISLCGYVDGDICRIAFGSAPYATTPVWSDVTSDFREFSTKKGRQHALNRMEAATITVTLGNDHYNYYPDNAVGDYYPNVLPGKRINIRKVYGGILYDIFTGYITEYPPDWLGESGIGAIMKVTAVGLIGNLAKFLLTDTYTASDTLLWGNYPEEYTQSTSYVKLKELSCGGAGIFRIKFQLQSVDGGGISAAYGKIYQNGVAVGTERSVASGVQTEFSEDLAGWANGDLFQIYAKIGDAQDRAYIANFKIYGTITPFSQELSGTRVGNVLDKLSANIGRDLATGQIIMQASTVMTDVNAWSHLLIVQQSEEGYIFEAGDGDLQFHDSATRLGSPYNTSSVIFSDIPSFANLVLYLPLWHENLNAATFNSRDLNYHACVVTGATYGTTGRDFDGVNQKISVAHHALFNVGTGNFAFECWIKIDDLSLQRSFLAKELTSGNYEGIILVVATDGTLWCRLRQDGSNYVILSGAGIALSVATFYHIVFLRTGTTLKAYTNGVEDTGLVQGNTGAGGASNPDNSNPLLLGLKSDNTQDFDGIIGEVRVYNRALSAAEILYNFNTNKWRFGL